MKKKIVSMIATMALVATTFAGCGSGSASNADTAAADSSEDAATETASDGEEITLKLFSNLPDRKNGQGLVEQTIVDAYMAEHPNVTIEVETLDEEAYKTKFKAYSMDEMPDIVSIWGQPSFLDEVLDAGLLAELNTADYADYDFVEGSLDGFMKDGKLYGLPRNTDVAAFYYNQKIFEDNGWTVPETYDDLLALAKDMQAKGVTPLAMDGGDGWPLAVYLTDVLYKLTGSDYANIVTNALETGDFSDPAFTKAAQLLQDSAAAGLFQTGFDTQDYGTAQNLFTNGQAAMYYMGSWDASMALNQDIPEEVRTNIRMFTMPQIEGGATSATDITAWNGGGYAVAAGSENLDQAKDFLNYMYLPENLSKIGWENGVGMSAQDESDFMTGNETELQMQFVDAVGAATGLSGTTMNDRGTSAFKTAIETSIQNMSNGSMTVEDFLSNIASSIE
ncbi:MAG: extracellular solute-binding protein [Pseudobutyrivibrio sp.]|nr:extracellular solute-binding protein [Pseudobutyrivibrio sp.]